MAVKPKTKNTKETKYTNKSDVDWVALGKEYCAGASIKSLSIKYKVSRPAIDKNIEKNEWKQDVSALIAKEVAAKVAGVTIGLTQEQKTDAIDKESDRLTVIAKEHQGDISRATKHLRTLEQVLTYQTNTFIKAVKEGGRIDYKELESHVRTVKAHNDTFISAQEREANANGIVLTPQESKATMNEDTFADIIKMAGANKSKG